MKHRIKTELAPLCMAVLSATVSTSSWALTTSVVAYDRFQTLPPDAWGHNQSWVSGPIHALVHNDSTTSLSVTNPSWLDQSRGQVMSYQGQVQAMAQSSAGVKRAQASVLGGEEILQKQPGFGVYAVSSWQDELLVTGSQGEGVFSMTAHLHGKFDVSDTRNSQGGQGWAYAAMQMFALDRPLLPEEDPLDLGLAFKCDPAFNDCDHDTRRFRSLAALELITPALQSNVVDRDLTFSVPFTYGKPVYLMGVLEVGAYSVAIGAKAEADFFHTGTITGFSAPAGATVQLQSGAYEAFALPSPVPEPSQWALAGCGALLALAMRRRPERKRPA